MSVRDDLSAALALAAPGRRMYADAHYLAATLRIADPDAMRHHLPARVSLADPARADLFCAWFPDNPFHPGYLEAGLFVHVRAGFGRAGIHCPWMIVDDDTALILGREVTGYPKKLGRITWDRTGDAITARAERRGTVLVDLTARVGDRIDDPPPFLGRPHRNVLALLGLPLPVLLAFTPAETPVEVRHASVELAVGGSRHDPLDRMGLGEVVHARLHRVDIAAPRVPPLPLRPVSPLFLTRHLEMRAL